MFQRNVIATSVAAGPNPSWNEELSVPFRFSFMAMSSNESFNLLRLSSRIRLGLAGDALKFSKVTGF